jgi:hypothetical protein
LKHPVEEAVAGRKPGTDALGRTVKSMEEAAATKITPTRKATVTKLFLTPPGYPNAISTDPEGRGFGLPSSVMTASRRRYGFLISRANCSIRFIRTPRIARV